MPFPALRASRPSPSRCWRSFLPFLSAAVRSTWDRGRSDREKPQAVEQKPTGTISAQSASDAQGYVARGQALAKSGKTEEALAEFDNALALDPYNVQALYGRGLIYQGEKQHEQAIEDFTAANGLTPQRAEPLLARATSYLAHRQGQRKPPPISTRRCRPTRTAHKPGRLAVSGL